MHPAANPTLNASQHCSALEKLDVAVVMSIDDYERHRCSAAERLGGLLDRAAIEAEAKGLT